MIIRTDDLQNICTNILPAVDANIISQVSESLSIKAKNNKLYFAVTNKSYYVLANLPINVDETFTATVNAELFLKLVSSTTTETIEFKLNEDKSLTMIGNGTYQIPLVFENDTLLELPEITLDNVKAEFDVSGETLNSILAYNTKQLSMGIPMHPVQKLYYVDKNGALTFTQSACINTFELAADIKMLFDVKQVRLFKLFKGSTVHVKYAEDTNGDGVVQCKMSFETPDVAIQMILFNSEDFFKMINIDAIRERATKEYPYTLEINKKLFEDALIRMKLVVDSKAGTSQDIRLTASKRILTISDIANSNHEDLLVTDANGFTSGKYEFMLSIVDLINVLSTCSSSTIKLSFGDDEAVTVTRDNITNIIPVVEE